MDLIKRMKSSMAASIIVTMVLSLLMMGTILSTLSFWVHFREFQKEYTDTGYHIADTATGLVNGSHIDAYLAGEKTEEYNKEIEYEQYQS